jgi:hypothetical protein
MPLSAKLVGLGNLIDKLKNENPNGWRLVVFTIRRETQTTIQNFLEGHGLKVGIKASLSDVITNKFRSKQLLGDGDGFD